MNTRDIIEATRITTKTQYEVRFSVCDASAGGYIRDEAGMFDSLSFATEFYNLLKRFLLNQNCDPTSYDIIVSDEERNYWIQNNFNVEYVADIFGVWQIDIQELKIV
jgi:hypothetical protein